MRDEKITIVNQLGLHARAAAKLVRLANQFRSTIQLHRGDSSVFADAKSILSVLTLAASKGTDLFLRIEGEDENAAFAAVHQLFEDGFGEL